MELLPEILRLGAVLVLALVLWEAAVLVFEATRRVALARSRGHLELALLEARLQAARAQARRVEQRTEVWSGTRKFEISRKVRECDDVCSFYLKPHDGRPLPRFEPGQFLSFDLPVPGQARRVVRCYSLSDGPREDYYRVTIKRQPPPPDRPDARPGLASNYFHSAVNEGDILDVKAPAGGFFLDLGSNRPVVLVAGGVGITPFASMLNALVEAAATREVWLFYGVRRGSEHIFKEPLARVAREYANIHQHVCYSQPGAEDRAGVDYDSKGHVNLALIRQALPSNNYEFFVCGPPAMMRDVPAGLAEWGVPPGDIHTEAFSPVSVRQGGTGKTVFTTKTHVTFARSNRKEAWLGTADSLLELAEAAGVTIDSGCRAGNCGTCKIAIKSGRVKYLKQAGCEVESGSCLTCITVPDSELVLDA